MEKQTILIVDDEEINRAVLSITFGDDFRILEAADGREALACIDAHPGEIVAVLLDVVMPVMDGFEVLRILGERKMLEQLPVFLITAENSEERLRLGYDLGAVDIIESPSCPTLSGGGLEMSSSSTIWCAPRTRCWPPRPRRFWI